VIERALVVAARALTRYAKAPSLNDIVDCDLNRRISTAEDSATVRRFTRLTRPPNLFESFAEHCHRRVEPLRVFKGCRASLPEDLPRVNR